MSVLTARVANSAGEATDTVNLAVSGEVTPWFEEDFSSYGSVSGDPTKDWVDNINGTWSDEFSGRGSAPGHLPNLIVPVTGIPGLPDGQGARFPQITRPCDNGSAPGRFFFLPNPEREVFMEMYIKFSANYKTDWRPECGGGGNPDHKFIFFGRTGPGLDSRWEYKHGVFGDKYHIRAASSDPGNNTRKRVSHGDLPNSCFNEIWQRLRFRLRSADQGIQNGEFEFWRVELEDGNKIMIDTCDSRKPYHLLLQGIAEVNEGFNNLWLGATFNVGPAPGTTPDPEWIWRLIRGWNTNPGWNIQ